MKQSAKNELGEFTNLYPVRKTLRFSLKPIGKTEKKIKEKKLLVKDEDLAEKYKQAKKIIDEYHKCFIDQKLSEFKFKIPDLKEFKNEYFKLKKNNGDKKLIKNFETIQKKLRESIAECFENKTLFSKEFIEKILPDWLDTHPINLEDVDDPKKIIAEFKKWTSYFKGFNDNRKNIYTKKNHVTGIAYRVVHENLPRFIDNLERYKEAKKLEVDFSEVEDNFKVRSLDEVFTLEYFNQCLTQSGIDQYNKIRGGISSEKDKQQGVNEKINLFAQQVQSQLANANDEEKKKLKSQIKDIRSCKLEELYKQILSDRSEISFQLKNIEDDAGLIKQIETLFFHKEEKLWGKIEAKDLNGEKDVIKDYPLEKELRKLLDHLDYVELDHVYLRNDLSLTDISQYLFHDWEFIKKCLKTFSVEEELGFDKKGNSKKLTAKEQESWLKKKYFSFSEIHKALKNYGCQFTESNAVLEKIKGQPLVDYFKKIKFNIKDEKGSSKEIDIIKEINTKKKSASSVLDKYREKANENRKKANEELKNDKNDVSSIKEYLDAIQNLFHFLKPLDVRLTKKDEKSSNVFEKDADFYNDYEIILKSLRNITSLYNQTRNYLTKKPYSIEKYKLNFENVTLAEGWDENKETANTCIIFRRNGLYYLGVMDKKHNKIFSKDLDKIFSKDLAQSGDAYEKMIYKLLPGPEKMLPKVFFGEKNIKYYCPSEKICEIRNTASHTKNGKPQGDFEKEDFNFDDMRSMIDFYKDSIKKHPDWKKFDFELSDTNSYKDISDFFEEIKNQGYKITFKKVSQKYIDKMVDEGCLYLFQIYNKDFSIKRDLNLKKEKKYKENLHTLYWKSLFDETNLKDVVYKLNGEAELFFRKRSITYEEQIWEKGHHAQESNKKQRYPIIKDRRYAQDTYLFHVPITLNFKGQGISKFNSKVNKYLKNSSDVNIIGIDRGERHLAYFSVINQKGELIKEDSLNNPLKREGYSGNDYQELLKEREVKMYKARKSWGTIGKIKDLKEGYLSRVIHKLAMMMVEHNAIIVFENLNFGFKRGRFKVERQIYQKLEKMLIDKLNYLMLKDKNPNEPGGLYQALQLTAPFESFKKLGKQSGFLFYVPAYHTSKVCPATGFVNLLYPRYETIKKSQEFYDKFDEIKYHKDEDIFSFSFDYSEFSKKTEGIKKHKWTIWTYGNRLINSRNKEKDNRWDTKEINLTADFKGLLNEKKIDFLSEENIKEKIMSQNDSQFFKKLTYLLRNVLQLRNSRINRDEDWIISPVKDEQGNFYDSRKTDKNLPKNADANGAYHIALKGLLLLRQLKESSDIDKFEPDLSNKNWYEFIQSKCYLK